MVNYGNFKNYYDFIEYGKTLKTDAEKLKYVTDYIKYYCEYDYTFLVLSFINNTGFFNVKYIYERVNPKGTYFENYPDCSQITHVLSLYHLETQSELYDKIVSQLNLDDLSLETLNLNLLKMRNIILKELSPYFITYNMVEYYVDDFINKLKEELSKTYYNERMHKYVKTIETALIDMCTNIHNVCKREYHNGMITKGVCEGFSDFIVRAMEDLDVPCVKVTSENHAWNLSKIDGKFVMSDTTNALEGLELNVLPYSYEIVDKKEFEEEKQYDIDWCNLSIKELFDASPNRVIYQVGEWELEDKEVVTKDNCEDPKILKVLEECFDSDVKTRKEEVQYALTRKNK